MKKIIGALLILVFSNLFGEYKYPFKNPYMATILGSSTLMTDGVSEAVPTKVYKVKLPNSKEPPENLWYNGKFEFSLVHQKEKAPLIFLLAGTGSDYHATRMVLFQRIFYDAGFHVISITSPMHSNFIVNASTNKMPGMIIEDGKDIYKVMKETYNIVKEDIEVSDFYVVGYILGGTSSAVVSYLEKIDMADFEDYMNRLAYPYYKKKFGGNITLIQLLTTTTLKQIENYLKTTDSAVVSYLDEIEKAFNFKRVFMVNPAVDIYSSAVKLDKELNKYTDDDPKKIGMLIDSVISKVSSTFKGGYTEITEETIYKLFEHDVLSNEDMSQLIGLAFRLTSIDLNYVTDLLNNMGVYVTEPVGKFTNMFPYFEKIDFADFEDYMNRLAYPYYKKKFGGNITLNQLLTTTTLKQIENYLKTTDKIVAVTNKDELILNENDFKFLENTFKDRLIIYPYGGHCGNMFYSENVDVMLKFLKEGVFKYEN